MGLSRLDNFLKNARGNILYVNPNDLDSTDSIENQGNSLARPFKTIQRALVEAARFSYQSGLDNDRFGKTTILLYPGDHVIDNRPGWIPDGTGNFRLRDGTVSSDYLAWSLTTNFDLTTSDNALYKLNSVHGGVILPRGTSIVGLDLRKTKIRPKYVPDPTNNNVERSAIFRVTGACYLWQFSLFDGDPNGLAYKDYTTNTFVPNFSHHKLAAFEYADGVNKVKINDAFISDFDAGRTDLEMYYEKVGLVYGASSGRAIEPDYPSSGLDIQPKVDEYRIVGPTGGSVGISSIRSGDGVTPSKTISVTLEEALPGLSVDTAFQVNGITATGYNGQFVVSDIVAVSPDGVTEFKYQVSNPPIDPLPTVTGSTINLQVDTVNSASPYIFNISQRSVYGMCGVLADGDKASGFKSMVLAQFTGIGLQKDKNAFVKYDSSSGEYKDSSFAGNENINADSRAVFKPEYRSFHVKTINDAYIQNVSIFAIGYAEHFSSDTGGDQSINNSNSNFGAKAIVSQGFKRNAFPRDDVGYITHIIPPKELETTEVSIEFDSIDVYQTAVGVASTSRLYLYNQTNSDIIPDSVIEGYRIGAKINDNLNVLISQNGVTNQYLARIVMPNSELTTTQSTFEKSFVVGRSSGINSITSNTLTFTEPHNLLEGESIRVIAENGHLPDGLENNSVYYAITSGVSSNQIKIAKTLNDGASLNPISINNKGGILRVQSRVSDKISGDIGHPIQYDVNVGQWYITVGTASTDNSIYPTLVGLGTATLGAATPRTFITRKPDTRSIVDTAYRIRYVIPTGSGITTARPPIDGYVLQESSDVTGVSNTEVSKYFSPNPVSLSNLNEQRNFNFIANAHWDSNAGYILSELPHNLKVGSEVLIENVISSNNPVGTANSGFNGTFTVTGISSAKEFVVSLNSVTGPGTFTNNTSSRTTSLPIFSQKKYRGTYTIYRAQEVREYVPGVQDGVYHLIITNSSNSPTVTPFSTERYSQPIQYLYPQTNRDNPVSDAKVSSSFAIPSTIGQVVIDDPQHSITRETIENCLFDFNVGFGITAIESNSTGTAHTIYSSIDHGLNRIVSVGIAQSGSGYGSGIGTQYLYNAKLVSAGAATTQGQHATARLTVNGSGNITNVQIMDGGSAYDIGDSLQVVGVNTTFGYSVGIVTVTKIYNNIGDTLEIKGVLPYSNDEYNTLYRITGIATNSDRRIFVSSASTIGAATTLGVGVANLSNATASLTGQTLNVSGFSYNSTTGIGIVTTSQRHGLRVDNKVKLGGADNPVYRGDFVVKKVNNQNSFNINIGIRTDSPPTSGTIYAYRFGYSSSGGNVSFENENLGGRQVVEYAGITTTLSAPILNASTTSIQVLGIENLDIKIGDYLIIDEEIVRVRSTVTSGTLSVFRGILGTRATSHESNSVVRRINCRPIEFRRNSIIRASGHTFEYVGFGPGNYSTALPDRQDRSLSSQEELLSQSTKKDGGINVYTGMNDQGDFYIGNKKVSSATGQEEVFDSPVPSVTGEDIQTGGFSVGFDVLTPLEASISRSIRVEGGPNGNIISEFDGPVVFNNKITSTSSKGMEATSLFLQGDATVSRKYTVGISVPTLSGNPGDVVYNANPERGGTLGWVYTVDNDWRVFGNISLGKDRVINLFDAIGIGTTAPTPENQLLIGSGSTQVSVNYNGEIGLGTTANGYKLNVGGNVNIAGTVTANLFVGDGSGLTNIQNDSLWNGTSLGIGTGIYPNNLLKVGIGTSVPHFNLDLGTSGTGTTDLKVRNNAVFDGAIDATNVNVGGAFTATTYRLDSSTGSLGLILAGIVTTSTLVVGTALSTFESNVGFGTASPRAKVDFEGSVKFKTYSEYVQSLSISNGNVDIDLSVAQTFTLMVNQPVTQFNLLNAPSGSTAFTIKIAQNSIGGYSVGIDTFKDGSGSSIPVYWAGGGVVPDVTVLANRTDIYSFKTFDGGSSLYGVVGGQNFA